MGSHPPAVAMRASLLLSVLSLASAQVNLEKHDLPQLFAYDHGSHAVAVYRGAALKAAIAAGLVKGFPGSEVVLDVVQVVTVLDGKEGFWLLPQLLPLLLLPHLLLLSLPLLLQLYPLLPCVVLATVSPKSWII